MFAPSIVFLESPRLQPQEAAPTMHIDAVIQEEVALEGLQGCPLSRLWELLELRLGMNSIDIFMKAALWPLVAKLKDIQITLEGTIVESHGLPTDFAQLSLYEPVIVLLATPELRACVLGLTRTADFIPTPTDMTVLEIIGRSRHVGITVPELARETQIGPQDMHYVLKRLDMTFGAVAKSRTYINLERMIQTNRIWLVRYAPASALTICAAERSAAKGATIETKQTIWANGGPEIAFRFLASRENHFATRAELQKHFEASTPVRENEKWFKFVFASISQSPLFKVVELVGDGKKPMRALQLNEDNPHVKQKLGQEGSLQTSRCTAVDPSCGLVDQLQYELANGLEVTATSLRVRRVNCKIAARTLDVLVRNFGFTSAKRQRYKVRHRVLTSTAEALPPAVPAELLKPAPSGCTNAATLQPLPEKKEVIAVPPPEIPVETTSPFSAEDRSTPKKEKEKETVKDEEVSLEFAQRCRTIHSAVEEQRVVALADIQMLVDPAGGTDRKTYLRAINHLLKRGEIKKLVFEVQNLKGRKTALELFTKPDMDETHPDVVALVQSKVTQSVTLPSRKSRYMQAQASDYGVDLQQPKRRAITNPEATRNSSLALRLEEIRAGYLNATCLQAQTLHMWLWERVRCHVAQVGEEDRDQWLFFPVTATLGSLPLKLFLQVFGTGGVFPEKPTAEDFEKRLYDLSPEFRKALFKKKAPTRVQEILCLLAKLRLLVPTTESGSPIEEHRGPVEHFLLSDTGKTERVTLPGTPGWEQAGSLEAEFSFWNGDAPKYWEHVKHIALYAAPEQRSHLGVLDTYSAPYRWSCFSQLPSRTVTALEEEYQCNPEPSLEQLVSLAGRISVPFLTVALYFFRDREKHLSQLSLETSKSLLYTPARRARRTDFPAPPRKRQCTSTTNAQPGNESDGEETHSTEVKEEPAPVPSDFATESKSRLNDLKPNVRIWLTRKLLFQVSMFRDVCPEGGSLTRNFVDWASIAKETNEAIAQVFPGENPGLTAQAVARMWNYMERDCPHYRRAVVLAATQRSLTPQDITRVERLVLDAESPSFSQGPFLDLPAEPGPLKNFSFFYSSPQQPKLYEPPTQQRSRETVVKIISLSPDSEYSTAEAISFLRPHAIGDGMRETYHRLLRAGVLTKYKNAGVHDHVRMNWRLRGVGISMAFMHLCTPPKQVSQFYDELPESYQKLERFTGAFDSLSATDAEITVFITSLYTETISVIAAPEIKDDKTNEELVENSNIAAAEARAPLPRCSLLVVRSPGKEEEVQAANCSLSKGKRGQDENSEENVAAKRRRYDPSCWFSSLASRGPDEGPDEDGTPRPWQGTSGRLNGSFLPELRKLVFMYVSEQPGVTRDKMRHHFNRHLHPRDVDAILDGLVCAGVLWCRSVSCILEGANTVNVGLFTDLSDAHSQEYPREDCFFVDPAAPFRHNAFTRGLC
eukprot:TRINITY_DN17040_c0_g1_i1.p1 TRINITY_DN17040_c0_g1~~TRINITY_DN17040_c0_g1_i1.p1  ORF type:complete len:1440 (-),score=174.08 TRINITY_DN17040_c0_g1_i1:7-4326(-)